MLHSDTPRKRIRNRVVACPRCSATKVRVRAQNTDYCSVICRFMDKVKIPDTPDACWDWKGAQDGRGYGQININGRPVKSYRWAFENIGTTSVVSGMTLDHLCRNRLCVNPQHLEQVSNRTNTLRGNSPKAVTYRTGVCGKGHSMENAIPMPGGKRTCRTCENQRQRRYYYAKKAMTS